MEALSLLDSIDYGKLHVSDRHYFDFLTIKANDKAYITHQSDSLILDVINYYSGQKKNSLYPEVLYYGGRVYSDLGDLPSALAYFQKSLDILKETGHNNRFIGTVLSQTGRLLDRLSLHEEAIPYIKESIEVDRQFRDSVNLLYNIQLLGAIYLRAKKYREAEALFKEALFLSESLPKYHEAKSRMYLAAVKYELGQNDSALYYIRNTIDKVKPIVRNSALAYATDIYLKAGILDTAYLYSKEIIRSNYPYQKESGYEIILLPELRMFSSADSIERYISEYRIILENYYNANQNQFALNQQNLYNYQIHEQEKEKSEKKSKRLTHLIYGITILLILSALIILYLKNKNKKNIIELQQAVDNIKRLKIELNKKNEQSNISLNMIDREPEQHLNSGKLLEKDLRDRLKSELLQLAQSAETQQRVSHAILRSKPFLEIQDYLAKGKKIGEQNLVWDELEKVILEESPSFRSNLNLLTNGKLSVNDLHVAILVKCGVRPSAMTILFGITNGAIVSRRETLCQKIFGEKKGLKTIDSIIRLL